MLAVTKFLDDDVGSILLMKLYVFDPEGVLIVAVRHLRILYSSFL